MEVLFVVCPFVVGFIARRVLMDRRVARELKTVPGFERVDTVDKLIDKAYEYSRRPEAEAYETLRWLYESCLKNCRYK